MNTSSQLRYLRQRGLVAATILAALLGESSLPAQDVVPPSQVPPGDPGVSLKVEIEAAVRRGVRYLIAQQDPETGVWVEEETPALSALPLMAIMGDPGRDIDDPIPEAAARGFEYLISTQKDDGGIYGKGLACYNTSLSVTALTLWDDERALGVLQEGRRFLVNQQSDFDNRGEVDSPYDGGIGYGGTYAHSDLSNTHFVLEALYHSQRSMADTGIQEKRTLDFGAAIAFVERCQNRPENEHAADWATGDPDNAGGFVYFPGSSKAGTQELPDGRVALRSYGSMTYAGMLSFIYAGMDRDDPRVEAAVEWLTANYSIEENPGMGGEGLYYYYHTMSKALSIYGVPELILKDGTTVDWRHDLGGKLLSDQSEDGSWINETGRWLESDRILVTSYAVLSLIHVYNSL